MVWFKKHRDFFVNEQKSLSASYPDLHFKLGNVGIKLSGNLRLCATFNDTVITDTYRVLILFPEDYPKSTPTCKEIDNRIPKEYHTNPDDALCLGTELEVYRKFIKNKTIIGFIENLLIPFLYRFSFIQKYNEEPFPDRVHGLKGIIDFYLQEFKCNDFDAVVNFLTILSKKKIRGHHRCPCGSSDQLRNCHMKKVRELAKFPKKIYKNDLRQYQVALQELYQN